MACDLAGAATFVTELTSHLRVELKEFSAFAAESGALVLPMSDSHAEWNLLVAGFTSVVVELLECHESTTRALCWLLGTGLCVGLQEVLTSALPGTVVGTSNLPVLVVEFLAFLRVHLELEIGLAITSEMTLVSREVNLVIHEALVAGHRGLFTLATTLDRCRDLDCVSAEHAPVVPLQGKLGAGSRIGHRFASCHFGFFVVSSLWNFNFFLY
jgi:hypothetical protein